MFLEGRELRRQRPLEGRPRLAAGEIGGKARMPGQEVGMVQLAQHRRHHQVADREAVFQVILLAEPGGKALEPRSDFALNLGPTGVRPFGIGWETILEEEARVGEGVYSAW